MAIVILYVLTFTLRLQCLGCRALPLRAIKIKYMEMIRQRVCAVANHDNGAGAENAEDGFKKARLVVRI